MTLLQLLELWEAAVSRHASSGRMWRSYLLWIRSHFKTFTVSSTRNAHAAALRALGSRRGRAGGDRKVEELEEVRTMRLMPVQSTRLGGSYQVEELEEVFEWSFCRQNSEP